MRFRPAPVEVGEIKTRGIEKNFHERVPLAFERRGFFRIEVALGNGDFRPCRENTHRTRKIGRFDFLHETHHVSRYAAAETMIELLRFVHGERRGLFVMKGTASPIVAPLSVQRDIAADNLHDIVFLFEFLHKAGVHPASAHTLTPPREKVSGINKSSNTSMAYLSVMPDR